MYSVSYTTRSPRVGESEGKPYHFVSTEQFEKLIKEGFFVEWAKVHEFHYGTPRNQVDKAFKAGKFLIMDLDVQGAESFKAAYPNCYTIFVHPPSIQELRKRLQNRDQGKTQNLEIRLKNAEIESQKAGQFDYQIVNEDFEQAYASFRKIIEKIINNG